jgi:large-conductance mechanosensitive channel
MFLQVLAQNSDIVDTIVNPEVDMNQLNQRLEELKIEYELLTQEAPAMSFFNFQNVYFWFVVCGLIILLLALWLLWRELKLSKNSVEPKVKKIPKQDREEVLVQKVETREVQKDVVKKPVIQIKVKKVK